jgi:hypothetical protein
VPGSAVSMEQLMALESQYHHLSKGNAEHLDHAPLYDLISGSNTGTVQASARLDQPTQASLPVENSSDGNYYEFDGNTEHLDHANRLVERAEYTSSTRNTSNHTPEQWEARQREIEKLYIEEGLSCAEVKNEMADKGFHAVLVIPPFLTPECNTLMVYIFTGNGCTKSNSKSGAGVHIKVSKITPNPMARLLCRNLALGSHFDAESALSHAQRMGKTPSQAVRCVTL